MLSNNVNTFAMSFLNFSLPTWFTDILASPIVQQMSGYMPHVLLAIALGAGIGLERRHRHKIAGVRTHLLVCVSSCIITLMGAMVVKAAGIGDATRIAGQILPALGFIGMGVITRKGWTTSGVTTAATILFTSGIGIMLGYGYFSPAVVITLMIIVVVQLSYWIFPSEDKGGHALKVTCAEDHFDDVRKLFGQDAKLESVSKNEGKVSFKLITGLSGDEIDDLLAQQVHNPHVITIELAETHD